ncbi:MAG: glutamate synthase subunit beta [Bacteroidales bacterium]|nr:glutamate synthase subunit beta [Bacteroidales bacterium]
MGNPKAFLSIDRKEAGYRPINERIYDFGEVEQTLNPEDRKLQASRCMDCGVPFCLWACPLGNKQPEWQDMVYKGEWAEAYEMLTQTNDFPEFTGRICPALCEKACVLNLSEQPVTIRENEAAVAERAFTEGLVVPHPPKIRSGKKVAVIGSGPAGLTCANQLNRKGHSVTVFEKDESIGGLLRLGIPDFKLNKKIIDRRLSIMEAEGIKFSPSTPVGENIFEIIADNDAVCLATGAGQPRDLKVEGRDMKGILFALEFLRAQNKITGSSLTPTEELSARGKHVLVIGGGDTGSDCVGTSIRQGALSVTQIEIMPKPPEGHNEETPWPFYPMVLKITSSHEEGCIRRWGLETKRFTGKNGCVNATEVETVEWKKGKNGQMSMIRSGKTEIIRTDLVLLAMGFVHPVLEGLLEKLNVTLDGRKNVFSGTFAETSQRKIFAAGDVTHGAGLVVRAIASGRKASKGIHAFLTGESIFPDSINI